MIKLKCDCCQHEEEFIDSEEAFQKGWDAPPHFQGYVACNLCPAAAQFMDGGWSRHAPIHEKWEREGRPAEFTQETCVLPEDYIPPERLDLIKKITSESTSVQEALTALIKARQEGRL